MENRKRLYASVGLFLFLCLPDVRDMLAASMIGQMIIQIPLLAVAGYLFGSWIKGRCQSLESNYNGIPGILVALFASFYWLLPRSIDAALNSGSMEVVKYLTVPLLIGLPLALSWERLASTVKGFIWTNLISMSFVMGWLYVNAPVRLCNNYLTDQQVDLGKILMAIAILLFAFFFMKVFFFGFQTVSSSE